MTSLDAPASTFIYHAILDDDITSLLSIRNQIKWLEAQEKLVKDRIQSIITEFPGEKVVTLSGSAQIIHGSKTRIDGHILLEKGVLPEIIEASKKVTTYVSLRVSPPVTSVPE